MMGPTLNRMHTDIREFPSGSKKQDHFGLMFVGNKYGSPHTVVILHKDFLDEWLPQVPLEMEQRQNKAHGVRE